jgi:hypothetical protein
MQYFFLHPGEMEAVNQRGSVLQVDIMKELFQ